MFKSKDACWFVTETFEIGIGNKSERNVLFEQILNNKFNFKASNFEAAAIQLQIEAKQKFLVDQLPNLWPEIC